MALPKLADVSNSQYDSQSSIDIPWLTHTPRKRISFDQQLYNTLLNAKYYNYVIARQNYLKLPTPTTKANTVLILGVAPHPRKRNQSPWRGTPHTRHALLKASCFLLNPQLIKLEEIVVLLLIVNLKVLWLWRVKAEHRSFPNNHETKKWRLQRSLVA